jgi:hypothetical protein
MAGPVTALPPDWSLKTEYLERESCARLGKRFSRGRKPGKNVNRETNLRCVFDQYWRPQNAHHNKRKLESLAGRRVQIGDLTYIDSLGRMLRLRC